MRHLISIIFFFLSLFSITALDNLAFEIQMIVPETSENRETVKNLLLNAGARASKIYGNYIFADIKGNFQVEADYTVQIMAVLEESSPVLVVTFANNGSGETATQSLMGKITPDTSTYLSDIIFKLWAGLNPQAIVSTEKGLEFLEEVPAKYIVESVISGSAGYSAASSIAVKEDGNLIVGMNSYCFEINEDFNVLSRLGKDLLEEGNYTFAAGVSVTPGGTIYMKPSMGRNIYRAVEGISRSQRIRAGIEVTGPIAVLNNGVIILLDLSARKFVRIDGNKRGNIDLNLGPYTYVMAIAAGPEGNLWIFDPTEQRIKVYSDNGNFINSIIPVGLSGEVLSPLSMAVYKNGSILLYSSGNIYKLNKEGILMWKMDGYNFRNYENFPMTPLSIAIDSVNGYVYLADFSGNRILKFFDPDHMAEKRNQYIKKINTLNKEINSHPESVEPLWEKVNYYSENNAWVLTKIWLEEILNIEPFNQKADEMLEELELKSLLSQVAVMKNETLDILTKIGSESARQQYSQTVQLYEKILSIIPGNSKIKRELDNFRQTFNRDSAIPGNQQKPLKIANVALDNVFPSLIHYYLEKPVGYITIKNDLDFPVKNLQAELNLRQFIDYPQKSDPILSLSPGEETVIDLNIHLNEKAFNIQEDLPVLVQINVSYEIDGVLHTISQTTGTTLYRRTALSWDNTAKLAAFIMPNEGIVSAFSHRVLEGYTKRRGFPEKMVKAARICDALGTYGISYVEDPDSPFSSIQGKEEYVDTVRYPRTTLHIKSGDCDDTTALVASLLESSGISTAIMTSPGHVFLAFDTEEPVSSNWMFETENLKTIKKGGTLWLPIESTVLSEGFFSAWLNASKIINRHKTGEIDFVPVKEEREIFPPLPLSESNLVVVEPGREQIDPLFSDSLRNLKIGLYNINVDNLEEKINRSSDRQKRNLKNKLGILHARFDAFDKAENIFINLITENNGYLSPYLNLGNLYYYNEDYHGALEILKKGVGIRSESVSLNLALARAYHQLNDSGNTEKYYRIVQSKSEEISSQFAYLVNTEGIERAGTESEPPIFWDIGEE